MSIAVGLVIGLLAGYFRTVDAVVMRLMDGLMAIPAILLAIALVALNRASVGIVIVAITIPEIPRVVRLVRAVVLERARSALSSRPRSRAARRPAKILLRHILPNTIAPLIVQATYICASAILVEAALSFLGAGTPPEIPSWGNMIAQSRAVPRARAVDRSSAPASRWRSSCSPSTCSATACATGSTRAPVRGAM